MEVEFNDKRDITEIFDETTQKRIEGDQRLRAREVARRIKSVEHFIYVWGDKGKFFLPPRKLISWHFISQVLAGEKRLLKMKEVGTIISLPKSKGSRVLDMWKELSQDPDFASYFPDFSLKRTIPRSYFLNVCLVGNED